MDSDRDWYIFLHDHQMSIDPSSNSESARTKDILSQIFSKVEGSDIVLQEFKIDFSSLTQVVASHTTSIKHLETQMGQMSTTFESTSNRRTPK